MSDLTLDEFGPLPHGKDLAGLLQEEARIIRGEMEGICNPSEVTCEGGERITLIRLPSDGF
jgi:hypothetical protein